MPQTRGKASLSTSRSRSTLRLHWLMDEQHKIEVSGRMRDLWKDSGETYRSVADAVGVQERTVAGWLSPSKPEAISYDNAVKVARLFTVGIDWVWRGRDDIRVPADFLDRFTELEEQVQELLSDDAERAQRAVAAVRQARQKSPSKPRASRSPKQRKRRAG